MAQIIANANPSSILRIGPFKGVNFNSTPSQLDINESPDMLNMHIDERGALNKRTGYERVFPVSLGPGPINGIFEYKKKDGTIKRLLAHGTKLYTWEYGLQPTEIHNGLANHRVRFFVMGDKCYIQDGTNYLVYDGTTVSNVTPYIPTLTISREPAGGGTPFEDFNLLGTGFKDSFSADGTSTVYQLSLTNLDATAVTAIVNGTNMTEGSGFTVDRVNGKVTFTTAPAQGTNNVIITAYKTIPGYAERIKKCTFHVLFGGANDTRVFISGNPDYPNQVWRSGLYDPTYWPENGYQRIGSDTGKIQAFAKQYDTCIILKEYAPNDTPIWNMQYELDSEGNATFPIKPLNDSIGCYAPDSVQIIENSPVFLDRRGVHILVSSNIRDERNVQHISQRVEPNLLEETNLQNAVSVDFDKKYWLALNGNVYIYDYVIQEWYLYDNIPTSCFMELDGRLYFGSSNEGLLFRFTDGKYQDDGQIIKAYWKSKYFNLGADDQLKIIEKVFLSLKPGSRTSVDLYYTTNKKESDLVITDTFQVDFFDFATLDFSRFSFVSSTFPQVIDKKLKVKKITHFQVILMNEKEDESLGITSVAIKYRLQGEVK